VRLDTIEFTAAARVRLGQGGAFRPGGLSPPGVRPLPQWRGPRPQQSAPCRSIRPISPASPSPPWRTRNSCSGPRAAGLNVGLSATGEPGELASFTGNGNAALTGTQLGEIHLFGLLSQVLSGLSLKFSSLKLDAAHTSFRLEHGRLLFPDLKITGPSAVIDARGKLRRRHRGAGFLRPVPPLRGITSI
jgi:hypothetical protein